MTVTLKHKTRDETKTVEVSGSHMTQAEAEKHVAEQYGEKAFGPAAHLAREWEVVPAKSDAKADWAEGDARGEPTPDDVADAGRALSL